MYAQNVSLDYIGLQKWYCPVNICCWCSLLEGFLMVWFLWPCLLVLFYNINYDSFATSFYTSTTSLVSKMLTGDNNHVASVTDSDTRLNNLVNACCWSIWGCWRFNDDLSVSCKFWCMYAVGTDWLTCVCFWAVLF